MSSITGVLIKDVTLDGITYKAGEEITIPTQLGLEDYFEDYIETLDVTQPKEDE